MIIETKFKFGDKVWTIEKGDEHLELPCAFCRGEYLRIESAGRSLPVECPECRGRRTVRLVSRPKWRVGRELTIRLVEVRLVDPELRSDDDAEREESYMAEETGVGSGSIHRVLFSSEEEAEAAVERRNDDPSNWTPSYHEVTAAQGFLDHRDVYEHRPEHVEIAEAVVEAARRSREDQG